MQELVQSCILRLSLLLVLTIHSIRSSPILFADFPPGALTKKHWLVGGWELSWMEAKINYKILAMRAVFISTPQKESEPPVFCFLFLFHLLSLSLSFSLIVSFVYHVCFYMSVFGSRYAIVVSSCQLTSHGFCDAGAVFSPCHVSMYMCVLCHYHTLGSHLCA